jgi:hypothetical protein
MDLSLESSLANAIGRTDHPGHMAGRPLEEWNAAYGKVESYFHALRIRNKVLLNRVVIHVLKRAAHRAASEPARSASELAAEEMDNVVTEWFAEVLHETPDRSNQLLSTRGRLALLLVDMPGKWQDQFLRPGPWPEEFVTAMRNAYLQAGPDFQLSKMEPRPLHLGPLTTISNFTKLPYVRMVVAWLVFGLVLILIFRLTHQPAQ